MIGYNDPKTMNRLEMAELQQLRGIGAAKTEGKRERKARAAEAEAQRRWMAEQEMAQRRWEEAMAERGWQYGLASSAIGGITGAGGNVFGGYLAGRKP